MSSHRVCTVVFLRRAFMVTIAVMCLLIGFYWSNSDNGERPQLQPARRDAVVILSATSKHICRALFTITSVHHNHSLYEVNIPRNSVSNVTYSMGVSTEEWKADESAVNYLSLEGSSAATHSVRHLLRKRSSPSGAFTTDYYPLAALLPRLLFFGDSKSGEKLNHRKYTTNEHMNRKSANLKLPFFLWRSRVIAGGGVLPYVPCTVEPYDDPASFVTCVKRRLEETPRLWLCFMGDSKVRYLFNEFLSRTDSESHYTVYLLNRNMSWSEAKKYQQSFLWTDMEALTQEAPRMRITYRFRRFSEMRLDLLNSTQELVELKRWASGAEPTPDLLVVGYTSWMMQWREVWNEAENHYPPDILDFLLQMHKAVVPLLEQIGQRTRVLVLSQSRLRPHSYSSPNVLAAFNPTNFDWSEMTFNHLLNQYRATKASHVAPCHLACNNHEDSSRPGTQEVTEQTTSPLDDPESYGAEMQTATQHDHLRSPEALTQATTPRDHLVPTRSTSGLWWWDSSLPLNLAAIQECDELYRRGLTSHPAFRSRLLFCLDSQHAGAITNNDMVTMLLNLICNSYLGLHHSHCCS
ncbi:uncharacterized protein [Panulirus ornatus]|uniref:uncharacterized protein n=1 Tax=Panulirus ornatus TaxID=150431 RepID=UPI003A862D44